jgi:hypothetical protein
VISLFGSVFAGLSSGAALGVAAVGTAAVVALYLLRKRERRVRVAFVALWEPGAGQSRVERLGRRLRRWLSLALQLLLLWLLVLALVDPRPAATAPAARSWLVLLDRSASMAARLGSGDRLGEARRQAHRLVEALGADDRAMVASFAREVTAETGFEADGRVLHAAVDRVALAEETADLGRALAFGAAVLRGRPRPSIVVISDGAYTGRAPAGIEVRWVPVGAPGGNVAILSVAARRRALDPGTVELTLALQSFAAARVEATVELVAGTGADARTVERLPVTLEPRERVVRTLPAVATRQAHLEARLEVRAPTENLLVADDRAVTQVAEQRRRRVLVVGDQNLYLDGALLSFGDGVVTRRVSLAAAQAERADWGDLDAVIFDGVAPAPAPTAGRFLYFDPRGPGSPWSERGVVRDPVMSDADRRHPLLAQVGLADLNIREGRRLALTGDDRAVASSFGIPLLIARERPGLKMVGLAFDVRRSDLPLRPGFPLLLANAFEWLDGPEAAGHTADTRRAAVEESDTSRAPALVLDGAPRPPWPVPPPARRPPWATLALVVALALSLVEWATHHRRWTV